RHPLRGHDRTETDLLRDPLKRSAERSAEMERGRRWAVPLVPRARQRGRDLRDQRPLGLGPSILRRWPDLDVPDGRVDLLVARHRNRRNALRRILGQQALRVRTVGGRDSRLEAGGRMWPPNPGTDKQTSRSTIDETRGKGRVDHGRGEWHGAKRSG